jgi:hypothetical protein
MAWALGWLLSGGLIVGAGAGVWWLRGAWRRAVQRADAQPGPVGVACRAVLRPVPWLLAVLGCLIGLAPVLRPPSPLPAAIVLWLVVAVAVGTTSTNWRVALPVRPRRR